MSFIDPYQIATCGQNSRNTFTLASNGILVDVFIEDIVVPIPTRRAPGGAQGYQPSDGKEEKKKKKKKVTVVATVAGKKYTKTVIVEDRPDLTVKDVEVDVNLQEDNKPSIKITILG